MKKFSKKLFCLMLVAIMVATAIPFGAFADATHTNAEHNDTNAVWVYNGGAMTATQHTLECSACSDEKAIKQENHIWDADGKCTVCTYSHTHSFTTNIVPSSGTKDGHIVQCDVNGCGARTTVAHGSETYTEIPAVAATCTAAGNTAGKTYICGYVEGKETIPALGHSDTDDDGKCDRVTNAETGEKCQAPVAINKTTYKVVVKVQPGTTLADGKSVEYTKTQVQALSSAAAIRSFLSGLGDKYAEVAANMTDANNPSASTSVSATGGDNYLFITLDTYGSEQNDTHEDEIQVIYDDGTVTYIPRKVGTWYFSTSNLGLDDTWGTTQAKLKIYDANGFRNVLWDSEDSDAFVKATDYKVEVLGINRTVTIYFMKTSTANPTTTDAFATKYYEANTRLGVLPTLPDGYTGWYVGQEELTVDTVYHWKEKFVYAYPGKGVGSGRVHLFIYNKDNELLKNVDVTENVQDNGLITKTGLMKTIEYQTGRKNPTVAGLFDESGWAYYLNNKNSTAKAKSSVDVGRAADRQGTQNIYVVLTNVSGGSNADTSNPKTGDTAMIGTAAIVMALAAVGMGTAFYMKKKELF